jgi:hypothetical protein
MIQAQCGTYHVFIYCVRPTYDFPLDTTIRIRQDRILYPCLIPSHLDDDLTSCEQSSLSAIRYHSRYGIIRSIVHRNSYNPYLKGNFCSSLTLILRVL